MLNRKGIVNKVEVEDEIPADQIRDGLRNLESHMPGEPTFLYEFASFLASKLTRDKVSPINFYTTNGAAFCDMRCGGDYGDSERVDVPSALIGNRSQDYVFLEGKVPEIVNAVCPSDFAQSVKWLFDEARIMARERRDGQ